MTEKIGTIKNPLTVIAIFAGIAEVSGTVVLPFIADANQLTFIYFLIIFPSILVILFFITLNFNNKALYAPSDFSNEENYIKIFKYDIAKQENVEIQVSQDELLKLLNNNFTEFKKFQEVKLQKLENDIKDLKSTSMEIIPEIDDDDFEDYLYTEEEGLVNILNFPTAKNLLKKFSKKGYPTEIYEDEEGIIKDYKNNSAIWLGYKYPFKEAKEIILSAKEQFPHLSYIDYSDNKSKPPQYIHHQIFVGGSTKTAVERGLKPLSSNDWEKLKSIATESEFKSFVKSFQ